MEREFITTNGKVTIENGVLQSKTFITRPSSTWFWVLFLLMYAVTKLNDDTKAKPISIIFLIFLGAGLLFLLSEVLFVNTWKRKISLNDIKSYKINHDNYGLESEVILFLKSGRQKKITFRNLERQMEPFLETITEYITQPQTSH